MQENGLWNTITLTLTHHRVSDILNENPTKLTLTSPSLPPPIVLVHSMAPVDDWLGHFVIHRTRDGFYFFCARILDSKQRADFNTQQISTIHLLNDSPYV